jgi:hypothetical protein
MAVLAWLAAAAVAGCTLFNEFNIDEDDEELCKDYKDNDSDGLKDCLDPECAKFAHCEEAPHPDDDYDANDNFCFDGIDQGGDGIMDCFVEACRDYPDCIEEGDDCSNGLDDNRNGLVDCQEESCRSQEYCWEDSSNTCHDGIDNDGDGWYDCSDSDCGERGFCPDEDRDIWCVDEEENDEDGDGSANCLDPDCSRFVWDCNPDEYSHSVLEEEFNEDWQYRWIFYQYDPDLTATKLYESIDNDKLHITVRNPETATQFRVEYGVASVQRFFLWNNITDIKFKIRVKPPVDSLSPVIPAVMGLSVDATGYRPFLDHDHGGMVRVTGRHSALMLLADGYGGIRLCFRRVHNTGMTCFPEEDPLPPDTEIAEGEYVYYRLYIDDSVVMVFQNGVHRLEIPNPFLPGVARLFFMGSTDESGPGGASELYVDSANVYQVFPFDVAAGEGQMPPDASLPYSTWEDPEHALLGNPDFCTYSPSGEIEATWFQNTPEKCSLHFDDNFADKKVQVQYDFVVDSATFGGQYAPGLWNPLMDYDSGLPLAAGMHFLDGDRFVFYPCRRTAMVPEEGEEMATPPFGTRINVVMGYDPDNNYSYAVLMDAASDRDFWSYGSYTTTCYELKDFGISSMNCIVCGPAQADGIISNIAISTHTPER